MPTKSSETESGESARPFDEGRKLPLVLRVLSKLPLFSPGFILLVVVLVAGLVVRGKVDGLMEVAEEERIELMRHEIEFSAFKSLQNEVEAKQRRQIDVLEQEVKALKQTVADQDAILRQISEQLQELSQIR